jgi:plasmid stabilization system protein ParE
MRRIAWSSDALDDLEDVMFYIGAENPAAAHRTAEGIKAAILQLAEMPVGRIGRVKGTHEWFVRQTSYVVSYSLSDDTLNVLHVIHGARDWPEGEWPAE